VCVCVCVFVGCCDGFQVLGFEEVLLISEVCTLNAVCDNPMLVF
jgi:hypothetical protein